MANGLGIMKQSKDCLTFEEVVVEGQDLSSNQGFLWEGGHADTVDAKGRAGHRGKGHGEAGFRSLCRGTDN